MLQCHLRKVSWIIYTARSVRSIRFETRDFLWKGFKWFLLCVERDCISGTFYMGDRWNRSNSLCWHKIPCKAFALVIGIYENIRVKGTLHILRKVGTKTGVMIKIDIDGKIDFYYKRIKMYYYFLSWLQRLKRSVIKYFIQSYNEASLYRLLTNTAKFGKSKLNNFL